MVRNVRIRQIRNRSLVFVPLPNKNKAFFMLVVPALEQAAPNVNSQLKRHIKAEKFAFSCCFYAGKVVYRVLRFSDKFDDLHNTSFAGVHTLRCNSRLQAEKNNGEQQRSKEWVKRLVKWAIDENVLFEGHLIYFLSRGGNGSFP